MRSERAQLPRQQPSAAPILEGWRSARSAMRPCSNSPKAISNIATSWARFARDGNGSKRAGLCYPGAGGTRRGHDRRAAYSTARLAACGGRSRPAVFGGIGVFCPPVKIEPQRSQARSIVLLTVHVERDRGFADSPLEEAGFEPTVPREKGYILRPSLAIMTASFSRKASVRSLSGPRVRIFFPPAKSLRTFGSSRNEEHPR